MRIFQSNLKTLRFTFFALLLSYAAFTDPPAAVACRAPRPSPQAVVSSADVIVRATALRYVKAPEGSLRYLNEPDDTEIKFRVEEILKGEKVSPFIVLNGYLTIRDDFNDHAVPYDFVRPGGRGGSCSAYEYKQGAEFLLFLKKFDGKLSARWYALAPTNEQLKSADDPWITWVKMQLKTSVQPVGRKIENVLSRPPRTEVRAMTWNIGSNSIFPDPGPRGRQRSDEGRPARFRNVIRSVAPDVVCLQEVYAPRTAGDAADLFDDIRPLGKGRKWSSHGEGDAVILSRYPLLMKAGRSEDYGGGVPRPSAWALVDRPAGKPDIFVICSHFQSRAAIQARQAHADMISALIRDLRSGGREISVPKLTPMLVMGDFNAYLTDPMLHISTLLSGKIADEKRFGPGTAPDWDDTPLSDALPVQNGVGTATYTFGDGTGKPNPSSALDRILYTDSVLQMLGGFVLNTVTMSPEALKKNRLQKDDVMRRIGPDPFYDHLPVVVDLASRKFRPGRARR